MTNKIYRILPDDLQPTWGTEVDGKLYTIQNFSYASSQANFKLSNNPISIDFKILPPFSGQKIVGLAYNYKSLISGKTQSEPLIFLKSPTSAIANLDAIIVPSGISTVWIEVELAVVVGKVLKNASVEECKRSIFGFTIGNDATALNCDKRDWHLARSKALDTFCPLGPYILTGPDFSDAPIRSYINNSIAQESMTSDRILSDSQALSFVSRFITLMPGDVVLTGTPAGATDALVQHGDVVSLEIEGLGSLTNSIVFEDYL